MKWRVAEVKQNMAEALARLRRICEKESYSLEVPPRTTRLNPFADALDDSLSLTAPAGPGSSDSTARTG